MLKRFTVKNFKGFKDQLVFDFGAKEYEFNKELVNNKIISKAIIYGKNGVGKSSLGLALFDIIFNLTDIYVSNQIKSDYYYFYKNLESKEQLVYFSYLFQFNNDEVEYKYSKSNFDFLHEEELIINGVSVLKHNYCHEEKNYLKKDLIGNITNLNFDLFNKNPSRKFSIIRYIYRNTPTNSSLIISKLVNFCENMLWYRSLSRGNEFFGFKSNVVETLSESLHRNNKLEEFKKFLQENDLEYDLDFKLVNGMHELFVRFDKENIIAPFGFIASTGTNALFLFFIWSLDFNSISLLFIDEFDAFFHFEAAKNLILKINKNKNMQAILTSHNTYLMRNSLTRPDCCFIMTNNKITSLCNATKKEIREAHDLEKMYINGAFNE